MQSRHECLAKFAGLAGILGAFSLGPVAARAQGVCDALGEPARCGEVSPLIPMQSTEAVHMGLVWKKNVATPKILFHARFPEYMPNDMADPQIIDLTIARGAFTTR